MTTRCMCTGDTICAEQVCQPPRANQNSEESVLAGLTWLAGAIGDYAIEVCRYSNDPEPIFSNGGVRVLIRSGRIDLV